VFSFDARDEVKREKKGFQPIDEIIHEEWQNLNQMAREGKLGKGVKITIR
jgi:hypothetical protein